MPPQRKAAGLVEPAAAVPLAPIFTARLPLLHPCSFVVNFVGDLIHGASRSARLAETLRHKLEDVESWMQVCVEWAWVGGGGCWGCLECFGSGL
jgi:hypothetical protein